MAKRIDPAVVGIAGAADIRSAAKFHKLIQAALKKSPAVELNIAKATDFDLAFIQLIESARRTAKAENKTVSLSGPATGALLETLKRGGFLVDAAAAGFWLQGDR